MAAAARWAETRNLLAGMSIWDLRDQCLNGAECLCDPMLHHVRMAEPLVQPPLARTRQPRGERDEDRRSAAACSHPG